MLIDYDGSYIQEEPFVFRECNEYEITLKQLLKFTHCSTECLTIKIVKGSTSATSGVSTRVIPEYLEEDVFKDYGFRDGNPKVERLLKYYGDCPCWNLVAEWSNYGKGVTPVLKVHVHFRDIRASFIKEREDMKKIRRRQQ